MIIDGKNHSKDADPHPIWQLRQLSKQTLYSLFRLSALFYYTVPARAETSDTIFSNETHPLMPRSHYFTPSSNHQILHHHFTIFNQNHEAVLAGDHRMTSFYRWYGMQYCFNVEKLAQVISQSLSQNLTIPPLNFSEPPCMASEIRNSNHGITKRFESVVYGLPAADCMSYQHHYGRQANQCLDGWVSGHFWNAQFPVLLFYLLPVFFLLIAWIVSLCKGEPSQGPSWTESLLSYLPSNPRSDQARAQQNLRARPQQRNPALLSETRGISAELKAYLASIEANPIRVGNLSAELQTLISEEEEYDHLHCSIGFGLMQFPVRLYGRCYDFHNIYAHWRTSNLDPFSRIAYNLDNLGPAEEIRNQLMNMITVLNPNLEEIGNDHRRHSLS